MAKGDRALVTGAKGFVGRWLSEELESNGYEVGRLGRETSAEYCVDIVDREGVETVIREFKPSTVFHLAAIAAPNDAEADPTTADRVNRLGTIHVLDAAASVGARVLFVSTGAVYGKGGPQAGWCESDPPSPRGVYAESKLAAESACLNRADRVDVVIARPFNHTGPGQEPVYVCSDFAKQIAECELRRRPPCVEVGNIDAERDFSDVRDVVGAYRRIAESGRRGEIYNVCSGKAVAVKDILGALVELSSSAPEIVIEKSRVRAGEVDRSFGNPEKIRASTGWTPQIDFSTTLKSVLEDWRRRVREAPASQSA